TSSASCRRRAAPARSFHQPSGREPTTLAPSTTSTWLIAGTSPAAARSLEELGEVLGQVERGGGLLVVEVLAGGGPERVGRGGGLLPDRRRLLGRLRGAGG